MASNARGRAEPALAHGVDTLEHQQVDLGVLALHPDRPDGLLDRLGLARRLRGLEPVEQAGSRASSWPALAGPGPDLDLPARPRRGMIARMRNHRYGAMACACGVGLASGLAPGPASAGQDDARLPALFDRLKTTKSAGEAEAIQQTIWASGWRARTPRSTCLMLEGVDAMGQSGLPRAPSRAFDAMVKAAPEFAEGWNKRATVEFLMGDFKARSSTSRRPWRLEPRHWARSPGWARSTRRSATTRRRCAPSSARSRSTRTSPRSAPSIKELEEKLEKRKI